MSRELTQLQESAAAILAGDAFFSPAAPAKAIEVLFERKGDIANRIKVALGKLGISVVVITPLAKLAERVPGAAVIPLSVPLVVQVEENVLLNQGANGTGKGALDVCVEVACLLHDQPHGVAAGNPRLNRFALTEVPITLVSDSPTLVYHVNFTAPLVLSRRAPTPAV